MGPGERHSIKPFCLSCDLYHAFAADDLSCAQLGMLNANVDAEKYNCVPNSLADVVGFWLGDQSTI